MRPLTTVFLDRDGTLNRKAPEGDYVKSPAELVVLPRVPEAIALLKSASLRVVVVTNQRGIALGRMTERDLSEVHDRLREVLLKEGADIDALYYCPHEAGACRCRKPDVGMFLRARADHPGTDFSASAVIGDSPTDIEPGRRLGMTTVFVTDAAVPDERRGDPPQRLEPEQAALEADHAAPSLWDAALWLTGGS